jgi:RNA polymerase sigma-70 factor (ECF subfamily)
MVDRESEKADASLALLVLRCQTGDERAFRRLLDQFGEKTLRYLRGLVGEDAEDVQQEVWLTVFNGLHRLANPGAFRTWLFRTARHRAIDHLRARKRERELIEVTLVHEAAATSDDAPAFSVDPSVVDAVIAQLPPLQREAMLLRYRDELSYEEIASVVGCPIGTVRTRLHYAKQRLQQLIDSEER